MIIPARNEEASLGACLESLVSQSGVEFEIIVVNDHSTDRTGEIAASFPGVRVIEAGPLPQGWTGKNNAVACGAREARGEWLLFTDADTVHLPGSLARALAEAKEHKAEMLSYSPEQIAVTFWEMAILPVVFAELARQYPPAKVSDPASPIAAANGQFILIRRETYDAVGGHAAVAGDILEDVALARRVKASGRKIRFRYAADAVRTRMYRSFAQLREGWTKNLALLFPRPGWLAIKLLVLWIASVDGTVTSPGWRISAVGGGTRCSSAVLCYLVMRTNRANFTTDMTYSGIVLWHADVRVPAPALEENAGEGNCRLERPHLRKLRTIRTNNAVPNQNHKTLMKPLVSDFGNACSPSHASHLPLHAQITEEPRFTNTMIEPGHSLGPLKLGDSLDRAQELFPKKDIDQEWDDACGSTIDWTDSNNPAGPW